jgi:DNA-binding transcriptional regulator YiaG
MKKEKITIQIPIPDAQGKEIVRTVETEVLAVYDETVGDYVLDGDALNQMERVKAREMGVLIPEQIKALRERLGLRQKDISELLQIGAKTWSRWENERERPSRSMNILLRALNDGRLDVPYLRGLQEKPFSWAHLLPILEKSGKNEYLTVDVQPRSQKPETKEAMSSEVAA